MCFSRFLNCINGIKLFKASYMGNENLDVTLKLNQEFETLSLSWGEIKLLEIKLLINVEAINFSKSFISFFFALVITHRFC